MKKQTTLQYLKNIEEVLIQENRSDRTKSLERSQELVMGRLERLEWCIKGLEDYLGIEFVRQSKYKKR